MGIHKYGPDTSSSQLGIKSLGIEWVDHALLLGMGLD